jgi:hypothetical protein
LSHDSTQIVKENQKIPTLRNKVKILLMKSVYFLLFLILYVFLAISKYQTSAVQMARVLKSYAQVTGKGNV